MPAIKTDVSYKDQSPGARNLVTDARSDLVCPAFARVEAERSIVRWRDLHL